MKRLTSKFIWLLTLLIAVVAIATAVVDKWLPPDGYVKLKYEGMSASTVFYWLENRSTRAIYIRGSRDQVWDSERITKCKRFSDISESSDPSVLVDGDGSAVIRVSPGARMRLKINSKLPAQYVNGGFCHLRLSLIGGVFIESEDFRPR